MLLVEVVQTIWDAIQTAVSSVVTIDRIFYVGVGFALLMVLFFFIKSSLAYEVKLEKAVNRINEWLYKNQTITGDNLIEFNKMIKDGRTPKILRKHWQQYMLYRDKNPSEYMSAYNCIDKPLKTSSFLANIKNFGIILKVTAFVTFFLSLVYYAFRTETFIVYISLSLVAPVLILIIYVVFTLILRTMQNYNMASLYQTFHIFNRYIDKASATIPKYVDFEVLFTKKEIKNGIPILGEYLEKRARQEQEELEEAQRNAVSHEQYDFSTSGVDGSLVLERAMKESETYLNAKQRIYAEIQQFEAEISTLKKNYENTSKDYQRKLQASKENMERLRQQQEESTNRIEVNYIRKQQQDEVKKQEQIEKDLNDATNKFNAEIKSLNEEIEKRRTDLELKLQKVQDAMTNEYQTFSNKLYTTISDDLKKYADETVERVEKEKEQYAQAIAYLKSDVDNKDSLIQTKDQSIEEYQRQVNMLKEEIEKLKSGNQAYVGNVDEGYVDGANYAEQLYSQMQAGPQYEEYPAQDEQPNAEPEYYEYVPEPDVSTQAQEPEPQVENEQKGQEEQVATEEPIVSEETLNELNEAQQEITAQQEAEEQKEEDADGHYDSNGYYWFNDETYYDTNGLYHDLEGNVYDSDGNLVSTNQVVEKEATETGATEQPVKEEDAAQEDSLAAEETETEEEVEAEPEEEGEAETEEEAEEEEPEEDVAPKRKAGRPRKDENANKATEEKRSVGRPKKEERRSAGRPRKDEESPKRSVGRPKKEEPAGQKRSVGRPKKEEKRSVGRPKKEEKAEPKRSVGRPKKEEKRSVGRPKKEEKRSVGRPKKEEKRSVGRPKKK